MGKKKPKKTLKYTCWRKDRHGNYQPYARFGNLELKMNEYTIDEVVLCRKIMKAALAEANNYQNHGADTDIELTPFSDFFKLWQKQKQKEIATRTLETYNNVADNHILPFLQEKKLVEITRKDIVSIIDKVYFSGKKSTAQTVHKIFSNFFKFCLRENFIEKSPFINISRPKYKYSEIQTLSLIEAKHFLKLIKKSKHALLFEIGLITGMRPEEYFGLRWSDIDWTHNLLVVKYALDLKHQTEVIYHELKSENSKRFIPVSKKIINKLKAVQKKQIKNQYNLVFPSEAGTPLRLNNIFNRHFKPIIEKITPKNITLYSLRHTTATLLLLAGENPKIVAERLGNSVEVTLKTYSHVSPNMQKSASEKLEKMLG